MDVRHTLVLLLALWNLTSAAQALEVVLFPKFPHLYVSDEVTLQCKRGSEVLTSNVKWYFNDQPQNSTDGVLHIAMATLNNSGRYFCKENSVQSPERQIDVLDMEAVHKLTLLSRRSLVYPGSGSLMELYVETGIHGWQCRYTKQGVEYYVYLPHEDEWRDNKHRATIHAEVRGGDKSSIFWCKNGTMRSNAITLRVSNKLVMLQALDPMVEGKSMSLLCEVRGVDSPDEVVFLKNKTEISRGKEKEYVIQNISNKNNGSYKCEATYSYKHLDSNAPQLHDVSDEQVLRIMAVPSAAQLVNRTNRLECQHPHSAGSFRWYHAESEYAEWKSVPSESGSYIYPPVEGFYRCRAEFKDKGVSYPSNTVHSGKGEPPAINAVLVVTLLLLILGVILVVIAFLCLKRRKRGSSGKKLEEGEDGGYEAIQMKGEKEGLYEPIKNPDAQGKGEGEYEALKTQAETYQTLKGEGKGEGEGQYEALKTTQTLKDQGQDKGEGEGGYQALKTTQAEVYQTLKDQDQGKGEGEGGYEALKTAQGEVYHTLKKQGEEDKSEGEQVEQTKVPQTE